MLLPAFLIGLALHSAPAISIRCGNNLDSKTLPVRSPAGFTVSLVFHSEDDHDQNTHDCAASYYIKVQKPGAAAEEIQNLINSDNNWGRPITFRIEGFNRDGSLAYVFISDGGRNATVEAIEYNMRTAKQRALHLLSSRAWGVTAACAASIHILGASPTGRLVFSTSPSGGCTQQQFWESPFDQDPNQVIQPKAPTRITSNAGVIKLVPAETTAQ